MAHYALIDENNIVKHVITGVDEHITQVDLDGTICGGSSEAWEEFYQSLPWFAGLKCKRTSYNNRIRNKFAGIGMFYHEVLDVFIAPQPYESWSLDTNFEWQPPVAMPTDGKFYDWNETDQEWVEIPSL